MVFKEAWLSLPAYGSLFPTGYGYVLHIISARIWVTGGSSKSIVNKKKTKEEWLVITDNSHDLYKEKLELHLSGFTRFPPLS